MTQLRRLAALAVAIIATPVGTVDAAESTAPVLTEAWFQACPVAAGCAALPPASTHPAETLHVGVSSGRETDRTYVELDLSRVPSGAALTGGSLVVPVADAASGTSDAEGAELMACLAPQKFEPERGSFAPAPPADCSVSTVARFAAGAFRVPLGAFTGRWRDLGFAALALLPSPAAVKSDHSWHIAISSQGRGQGEPMRASLSHGTSEPAAFRGPGTEDRPAAGPSLLADDAPGVATEPTLPLAGEPASGLPEPAAPEIALPPVRGGGFPAQAPARVPVGFAYPAVWLLPLALLVAGAILGRSLTRPVAIGRP